MHYIYKIKNLINDKIYIGKTINLKSRFKRHQKGKTHISNAIRKYGKDNFKFEVLEVIQFPYEPSREDIKKYVDSRESYYIEFYDSYNTGYNHTKGGDGIDSDSAKFLHKIRLENGSHHLLSGDIQRKHASENVQKRLKSGIHPFLTKENAEKSRERTNIIIVCPYCNRNGKNPSIYSHIKKCKNISQNIKNSHIK